MRGLNASIRVEDAMNAANIGTGIKWAIAGVALALLAAMAFNAAYALAQTGEAEDAAGAQAVELRGEVTGGATTAIGYRRVFQGRISSYGEYDVHSVRRPRDDREPEYVHLPGFLRLVIAAREHTAPASE